MMRSAGLAIAAVLGGVSAAAAAPMIADCESFKRRWSGTLASFDPGHPTLAYAPVEGGREPLTSVTNARSVEARLRCGEGQLVKLELRQLAGGAPGEHLKSFLGYAVAALVALDGDVAPKEALGLVETLRSDATATRDAISAFGPYEVSVSARSGPDMSVFQIDLPEN